MHACMGAKKFSFLVASYMKKGSNNGIHFPPKGGALYYMGLLDACDASSKKIVVEKSSKDDVEKVGGSPNPNVDSSD